MGLLDTIYHISVVGCRSIILSVLMALGKSALITPPPIRSALVLSLRRFLEGCLFATVTRSLLGLNLLALACSILVILRSSALAEAGIVNPSETGPEEWTQWRGPNRNGKIEAGDWPSSLGEETLKMQWSNVLAEGYASPVLTEDRVFSVETRNKSEEVVRAFDRANGNQIWEYLLPGAMKVPFFAAKNGSWARSTPATDGTRLFVLSMLDVLTCLDVSTGREIWQVDFKEREGIGVPSFGGVSSPLIDGDSLIVQGGSAVAKLNGVNSENVWRVLEDRRGMFGGAFSSPVIARLHGVRQLVVQTRSTLGGINLESGDILWSTPVEASRGMNILTPAVVGNRIFTATYGGGSFCYEVREEPEGFSVELIWQKKEIEGYMSSPVIVGNHIFHHGRDKRLRCMSIETGESLWVSDRVFGQYWSMVANGSRVLALDQTGELFLFEASPLSFEIIDERTISDEPTWAHLAISGAQLFVRSLKGLTAYLWLD